jgi:hypothetical protein
MVSWIQIINFEVVGVEVVNFSRFTNHQLQGGGYGGELHLDYKSSTSGWWV